MKILIVLASGIGNSIMFGPTLIELRKTYPNAIIDIYVLREEFAAPFTDGSLIDKVYIHSISSLLKVRKEKYDYCITAFPSNKWQFNLFSFFTGAKKRLTHKYAVGKLITLSFLQNNKIEADETLHDVDQNTNLLKLLDIRIPERKELFFFVDKSNIKFAEDFINRNHLEGKTLIGVHPGSGPLNFKRAPEEVFIDKINSIKSDSVAILIFGSFEENEIKRRIKSLLHTEAFVIYDSLKNIAALIAKCDYFITNDTGLMHIAVASKKPKVIALFHGTNPTRTRPYSDKAEVIVLKENMLKYPFYSTRARQE